MTSYLAVSHERGRASCPSLRVIVRREPTEDRNAFLSYGEAYAIYRDTARIGLVHMWRLRLVGRVVGADKVVVTGTYGRGSVMWEGIGPRTYKLVAPGVLPGVTLGIDPDAHEAITSMGVSVSAGLSPHAELRIVDPGADLEDAYAVRFEVAVALLAMLADGALE